MSTLKRPDFWFAVALAALALMIGDAKAADGDYESPHHFNVVFHTETTIQEVTWQALNLVDTAQTLYIADHPAHWQEVGQAGIFCGNHPSRGGVIATMAGFALLHYAVTVGIENLVQQNNDYEVVQRVWQYTNLGFKAYTVVNNHAMGIKP